MKHAYVVLLFVCAGLILPRFSLALPPTLTTANYLHPDRLLVLEFDQNIDPATINADGFFICVGPDYTHNTHQLQLVLDAIVVENQTLTIPLSAVGINGEYEVESEIGVYETRYTWGQLFTSARFVALQGATASLRCYLDENAVTNMAGEGNRATTPTTGRQVTTGGWIDPGPSLVSTTFDEVRGIITFGFDEPVQYDMINEDLSIDGQPGDSSLQFIEDRNHNGNLDFEQNIFVPQISIIDQAGNSYTLHAQSGMERVGTSTFVDDISMDLRLTMVDRIALDAMDLTQSEVSMGRWAFTGLNYQGNAPGTSSISLESIILPIGIDGVTYDAGENLLTIRTDGYCSLQGTSPVQFGRIHFTSPSGSDVTLTGSDWTRLSPDNSEVRIDVTILDQMAIEHLIDLAGGNPGIIIDSYAIHGELGERNERAEQPLFVVPETESHHGPIIQAVSYDRELNQFSIDFDLRIEGTLFRPDGFSLTRGDDLIPLGIESVSRFNANRSLTVQLTSESAGYVEQMLGAGESSLHIDPFTVLEQSVNNGNPEANVVVTVAGLDTPPVPISFLYYYQSDRLKIKFTQAIRVTDVAHTGITYSGVELNTTNSILVKPDELMLNLSSQTVAQLDVLPFEQKMNPVVSIAPNVFRTTSGTGNEELNNLTLGSNLSAYGGPEYFVVGMGNLISKPNYEVFPREAENVDLLLRRRGTHCQLFVQADQLVPSEDNNNQTSMTEADIDAVYNLIETSTPGNPDVGAYTALLELLADGREGDVPNRCNIYIVDIKDEAGKGRNDTDDEFFLPYKYIPPSPGVYEQLLLDCHPQTFRNDDRAYTPEDDGNWRSWATNSGDNAVVGLLTHWMMRYVEPNEEEWVVNGLSSVAERLLTGDASFFGEELPRVLLAGISLTTTFGDHTHLKNRNDLTFGYYFFEYLYEKYGGAGLFQKISTESAHGVAGISNALDDYRSEHPLEEPFQTNSFDELFLDFALAGTVDDEIGGVADPYEFSLFDLYFGFSGELMRWRENVPPPYRSEVAPYSIERHFTTYGPYDTNPLLDPNGLLYVDGQDGVNWKMATVRCVNPASNLDPGDYRIDPLTLDTNNRGDFPLSIPDWQFGRGEDADYATNVVVSVHTSDTNSTPARLVLNNGAGYFFTPSAFAAPASPTSVRINIDLPWGEMGFGTQLLGLTPQQKQKWIQGNRTAWANSLFGQDELDNEGGLTGFTIRRIVNPNNPEPVVVADDLQALTFLDTGLESGRTYYYEVEANYENPAGTSEAVLTQAQTHEPGQTASFQTTLTNNGVYGDPIANGPSMEFPFGSGVNYLWDSGLVVGVKRGGVPYASRAQFGNVEWSPEEDYSRRSILFGGSQLEFTTSFHDETEGIETHDPIGLSIQQRVHTWSVGDNSDLSHVMVIHVDVQNIEFSRLDDVYIGWVFDGDIGIGPNGDPTSPHLDDMMGVDRERHLAYMFDSDDPSTPEDDTGEFGQVPGYLGVRMMSSPASHIAWWAWDDDPFEDAEMYALLDGTSERYQPDGRMLSPLEAGFDPFDYRILSSVGPYTLEPGEVRTAEVAIMVCNGLEELEDVADLIFGLIGDVPGEGDPLPVRFTIGEAYPNPFNGSTTLTITLPQQGKVGFELYDVLGRSVYSEHHTWQAGVNRWQLNAPNEALGSGVYLLRIEYGDQQVTRKLVHIK